MGIYLVRTFLFTNPMILLALEIILPLWVFHFRSLVIMNSQYGADILHFLMLVYEQNN